MAASLLLPACAGDTKEHDALAAGASAGDEADPPPVAGASGSAGGGGGTAATGAEGDAVAPAGLSVTERPGACGPLGLAALTLQRGTKGAELYVALKNDGASPACSPAFSVELFDRSQQPVATGLAGLLVRQFYRLTDGSDTVAACVGPGELAMAAILDLPAELVIEDVGDVVYWCNYWVLDAVAIDGFSIRDVRAVPRGSGVVYTGTLFNGFDIPASNPSVAVFPLSRAGRPLGVALGQSDAEVPPGGQWDFETDTVSEAGFDHAAYPTGGP